MQDQRDRVAPTFPLPDPPAYDRGIELRKWAVERASLEFRDGDKDGDRMLALAGKIVGFVLNTR